MRWRSWKWGLTSWMRDNIKYLREETDTKLKGIMKDVDRKSDAKQQHNSIQNQFNSWDPSKDHNIKILQAFLKMFHMFNPETNFKYYLLYPLAQQSVYKLPPP